MNLFLDVLSPGRVVMRALPTILPVILVILVVIVVVVALVRRNKKK